MSDTVITNPGGISDIPDHRDIKWEHVGAGMPPFDWEQGYDVEQVLGVKLPIKDQNGSGSCGGQETAETNATGEAAASGSYEESSAKGVIAKTFILDAQGNMLGSRFRDNSELAIRQGVPREIILPSYDNGMPPTDAFMNRPQDITEAVVADAAPRRDKSYAYVSPNIDAFAQATAVNHGMGMLIRGSNNGTWLSPSPKPGAAEWGHFMYIGKALLLNGKKVLKAKQSWGKNVGEDGWQYFDEEWFSSGMIEAGRTFVFDQSVLLPPKYTFTRDLHVGSTGIDVRFLQAFLNAHGCPVALSGPGSAGSETSSFLMLTKQAVAKFQRDNGISPALGYFGPITRAKINSIQ